VGGGTKSVKASWDFAGTERKKKSRKMDSLREANYNNNHAIPLMYFIPAFWQMMGNTFSSSMFITGRTM
jgi:hypothetical protein